MKSLNMTWTLTSLAAASLATFVGLACALSMGSWSELRPGPRRVVDLTGFSALAPIDMHAHAFKDDPAFAALLKRLNLRILNICVVDKHNRGYEVAAPQNQKAREIMHSTGGRAVWCTTFDPQEFENPGFAE